MVMGPSAHASEPALTERDRQREETRRRVREIALDVIRREGLGDARVDEIARTAGVSRGTVYFHYPTKEHVVSEVFDEAERRIGIELAALPRATPLRKALDVFAVAFAREWEGEPELFPAVAAVALRRAAATIRSKQTDFVHHALSQILKHAAERGELTDAMRPPVLADLFLVNVLAAALAWSARPRLRLTAVLGSVIDIFLGGAVARR